MTNLIVERLQKHRSDFNTGIYSVCSINHYVLEAAMYQAKEDGSFLLVESTSNQVDQFGGYSGLTPMHFKNSINKLAQEMKFPSNKLILGGDHLGPNVWQNQLPDEAMNRAVDQISAYVEAGYNKIHLDTSMRCKADPSNEDGGLPAAIVAKRAAELCQVSEKTFTECKSNETAPVYIIGSDVPIPGGAQEKLENIKITDVAHVEQTIELTHKAFLEKGLDSAWERVLAVVVQPGIEFSDTTVIDYDRSKASELSKYILQKNLVYEAHSTDYQYPDCLEELVEDHYGVLKVGPWLTYALREAIFALAAIEQELLFKQKLVTLSNIRNIIEQTMLAQPGFWQKHYHGTEAEITLARSFSLSDRVRYYWSDESIIKALNLLVLNLSHQDIPLSLISQYLPNQYWGVREKSIENNPLALIYDKIREVLKFYARATDMANN